MRVAGHEIVEEIARGGMGIVYRARQADPHRTVALKMLLPHQIRSKEMAGRFRLEVRTMSELEHPAILPVYHVGEHDGLPFFTMKLASGGTLAQRRETFAGDWRGIASLMATLAEAVQFAHERGVLHRDLKPGNVLFDDADRPYVSDFGLAKLAGDDSDLTRSVDFLGTPHYVAPEIAASNARQATTASDIYGLGAILYVLLTGRPPFEAEGMPALLRKIVEEDPVPPSRLCGGRSDDKPARGGTVTALRIPRDLEVICLKCLAKEPARRYGSARELTEDLRLWLAGRPILGRRATPAQRLWAWVRRNPRLAAVSLLLLMALILGASLQIRASHQLRRALADSRQAEASARDSLHDSLVAEARAQRVTRRSGQRWETLAALQRAAQIKPTLAARNEAVAALALPDLRLVGEWPAYYAEDEATMAFSADLDQYATGAPEGGFVTYSTSDHHELRRFPGLGKARAMSLSFSPDGRRLAVVFENYRAQVWRLDGDAPELILTDGKWHVLVDFSPDHAHIAAFADDELFLQRLPDGPRRTLLLPESQIQFLRFDPAGERLAFAHGATLEVWSCARAARLWTVPLLRPTGDLAWSPDGKRLAAASAEDRAIHLFDAATGRTAVILRGHQLSPRHFSFHPDGRRIVSTGWDQTLRLWDAQTGRELLKHHASSRALQFSPDGRRLGFSPGFASAGLLEVAAETVFKEFHSTVSASETGYGITASPDGRFVAVTSSKGLRIYDARAEAEVFFLPRTDLHYAESFFPPDGRRMVFTLLDKGIFEADFRWRDDTNSGRAVVELGQPRRIGPATNTVLDSVGYDGRSWVVTYGRIGPVELWPDGRPEQAQVIASGPPVSTAMLSPDRAWAASALYPAGDIRLWDARRGTTLGTLRLGRMAHSAFSPDGRWLMTSTDQEYRFWETGSWKPGPVWPSQLAGRAYGEMKFALNSRTVAVQRAGDSHQLLALDPLTEQVTLTPPESSGTSYIELSPDGQRLYILGLRSQLFAWDVRALRRELAALGLDWEDRPPHGTVPAERSR